MADLGEVLSRDEHEILHMSKRMKLDGDIYDREVSYLSDHQVFQRFAKNGDWGRGWSYWKLWENLEEIYDIAQRKEQKGWTVIYHPAYRPQLQEFTKSVTF